jgi:hypothetical protein
MGETGSWSGAVRGNRKAAAAARPPIADVRDRFSLRSALMLLAAALIGAASFLPLWGMTLVSVQYPEGLRMVIYPTHIRGDITEINLLNHYIGMAEISNEYFAELRIIPILFAMIAVAALGGALVRRAWASAVPLLMMAGTAAYGFWSMQQRLYQFGHDLDPTAAIEIEPFTPAMLGDNVIAQFATYAYFSWGTFLPMIAGGLICAALWLDLRRGRASRTST